MVFSPNHKRWILAGTFLLLFLLTLYMVRNFLGGIFLGALAAYFLHPVYQKLLRRVRRPILAQTLLSIGSLLVLLLLLAVLIVPLAQEAQSLYTKASEYAILSADCEKETIICDWINNIEFFITSEQFQGKLEQVLQKAASFLAQSVNTLLAGVINFIIFLTVFAFSIYYFLDHGVSIKQTVVELLPFNEKSKKKIVTRIEETLRAVVAGNISTSFLQGIALGIIFAILGLPLAIFWGVVTAVLAFIPAVGAPVVWIPAVVILFFQERWIAGAILLVYCAVVLGYIDNLLKPKLIGDKIKLSSYAIFLGVLGGLQVFGILGIFIGPLVIALLVTFVDLYREVV